MHVFQSRNRAHLCESELCSRLEIRLLRSATDLFFARFAAQNRRFWVFPENQKNRTGWKVPPSLFVCETKRTKVCLLKSPRKRPCDRVLLWDPLEKYFFARAEHVKNGCFWAKNKPRVCAEAEWNQITKYNPTTFHVADKVHLAEFQLSYNRYSRLLRGRKKTIFFRAFEKKRTFFRFFLDFSGNLKNRPGSAGSPSLFVHETKRPKVYLSKSPWKRDGDPILLWDRPGGNFRRRAGRTPDFA